MILLMLAGEKCDGPVLPVFEADTSFLELEVIGGFRVWQLAFMAGLAVLGFIIFLCCIFRCRIPRTKQEIEADCARKKVAKQFSTHLQKIPGDRMELEKVLPEVMTLEEQRIAKGIKEEKMTFFQKLKHAIFPDAEEDEEDEKKSSIPDSLEKVSIGDIDPENLDLEGTIHAISTIAGGDTDRLSSHQEQLTAAIKKLHNIRLVQQQLQSRGNMETTETPERKRKKDTASGQARGRQSRHDEHLRGKERRQNREGRSSSRESGHESVRAQVLLKQKTCPQIQTDASSTDASTLKRSASDETMKSMRDKRGKRLSRQIGLAEHDVAVVSPRREDAVYEEIDPQRRHSPLDRENDDAVAKSEARTKF